MKCIAFFGVKKAYIPFYGMWYFMMIVLKVSVSGRLKGVGLTDLPAVSRGVVEQLRATGQTG